MIIGDMLSQNRHLGSVDIVNVDILHSVYLQMYLYGMT